MTDFAKLLNAEQLEAVTAGDGPLLVLAAAGTGKTRTLVHRVAYLLEQGEAPESLLLLTFTNRAAKEMLERAEQVAGPRAGNLWSGTFHHVCHKLLRRHAHKLSYDASFSILDRDDSRAALGDCMKAVIGKTKDFPKKEVIASIISSAGNSLASLEDVVGVRQEMADYAADIVRIGEKYHEAKMRDNQMDFDDLLINGLRLLKEYPDIRERYQEQFRHVLLDEYQDTNLLQAQMSDILAWRHRNIMAVGDDFQCIYSWRGANFRNIMDFPKRWDGCKVIKLEQNYRSVPEVLEVANACIAGNPEQFQKTLRATRAPRCKPHLLMLRDDDEQAAAVLLQITRYMNQGYSANDIAVLYRAHFHSIDLQMALARRRMPFVITSGVGVFDQAHTKDVLAFLKICAGVVERISFGRFLCMLPSVGPKTAEKVWDGALSGAFDPFDTAQRLKLRSALPKAAQGAWAVIDELLQACQAEDLVNNPGELIQRFCDVFYRGHLTRAYENPHDRERDIRELAVHVEKSQDLTGFLNEVALMTNIDHEFDRGRDTEPRIHLSTVHQAKGLEWPVVIILWLTEEMFPSEKSLEDAQGDEEERRLFYVAVTRAKDELILCSPAQRRMRTGFSLPCRKSRFLRELPHGLVRESWGLR